jgi:hypothetical protein
MSTHAGKPAYVESLWFRQNAGVEITKQKFGEFYFSWRRNSESLGIKFPQFDYYLVLLFIFSLSNKKTILLNENIQLPQRRDKRARL